MASRIQVDNLLEHKQRLCELLLKCSQQLKQVRTGEDFEVECWSVADEADALLKEVYPGLIKN